jgi:hypothetical protein
VADTESPLLFECTVDCGVKEDGVFWPPDPLVFPPAAAAEDEADEGGQGGGSFASPSRIMLKREDFSTTVGIRSVTSCVGDGGASR